MQTQLANRILRRHFDTVNALEPIIGHGSVNEIFAANVTDGKRVILRMCDRSRGDREHPKEAWCLAQAAAAGIPSPTVLAVGIDGDTSYMIQTFVDGVNGKDFAGNQTPSPFQGEGRGEVSGDRLALWRTLGDYARRIHNIPVKGFGNTLADYDRGEFTNSHTKTWHDSVDYNLGSLTPDDPLIALGVYTLDIQPKIAACLARLKELPVRIGLNHCDIAMRNTLVDPSGKLTLLDWGCATVSVVPHVEFSTILTWYSPTPDILDAFFDGYGLTHAQVDALMPELRLFQLIQSFDTLRWAIDHSVDVPRYVDRARETVTLQEME